MEKDELVRASLWLAQLADAGTRRRTISWLLAAAFGGFGLTMLLLIAGGRSTDRWLFVLAVWLALVFVPLWLTTAAFETLGPALRVRLVRRLLERPDRYEIPGTSALLVAHLFARHVVLPRIATPREGARAREAASAVLDRARVSPSPQGALRAAIARCLVGVEEWARELGAWAAATPENVQARWEAVRALAALAALGKTLVAVYEDQTGRAPWPGPERGSPHAFLDAESSHAFLDAALDYCDELALRVEVAPWEEPPLDLPLDPGGARLREAWQRYAGASAPTPETLEAWLAEIFPA